MKSTPVKSKPRRMAFPLKKQKDGGTTRFDVVDAGGNLIGICLCEADADLMVFAVNELLKVNKGQA